MSEWPKLVTPGTVTIQPSGKVLVSGFDISDASCREAVQIAIAWAQVCLGNAMREGLSADQPKLSAIY